MPTQAEYRAAVEEALQKGADLQRELDQVAHKAVVDLLEQERAKVLHLDAALTKLTKDRDADLQRAGAEIARLEVAKAALVRLCTLLAPPDNGPNPFRDRSGSWVDEAERNWNKCQSDLKALRDALEDVCEAAVELDGDDGPRHCLVCATEWRGDQAASYPDHDPQCAVKRALAVLQGKS